MLKAGIHYSLLFSPYILTSILTSIDTFHTYQDTSQYILRKQNFLKKSCLSWLTATRQWKVEHLQVFVDWWKLLDIGRVVLQDITPTEIVKPKEIANAIRKLEERIELHKQAVS